MPTPSITWTEAAMVQPGQRQLGLDPSDAAVDHVVDAGPTVIVVYTDGTRRPYPRNEDLPILNED